MRRFFTLSIAMIALMLSACAPKVDTRGHVKDSAWREHITPGQTTKDQVLEQLGSPSAQSGFGEETWYYITIRQEAKAFFRPENTAQDVLRIVFDADGIVTAAQTYDRTQAQALDPVKRTTPTEGHSMTVVEQFLGNIGRFNKTDGGGIVAPRRPRR